MSGKFLVSDQFMSFSNLAISRGEIKPRVRALRNSCNKIEISFMICFLKRPREVQGMGELYHICVLLQDFKKYKFIGFAFPIVFYNEQ